MNGVHSKPSSRRLSSSSNEVSNKKTSAQKSGEVKSAEPSETKEKDKHITLYYRNAIGMSVEFKPNAKHPKLEGLGKLVIQTSPNKKTIYEGNFKDGAPHGHGVMQAFSLNEKKEWVKTASRYEGFWLHGLRSTEVETNELVSNSFASSPDETSPKLNRSPLSAKWDTFRNLLKSNKASAYSSLSTKQRANEEVSTMSFSNGDLYVGHWKEDKLNGKGKKIYSGGAIYDGNWTAGIRRDDKASFTFSDGLRYEGAWDEAESDGLKGALVNSDGKVLAKGTWKDGKIIFNSVQQKDGKEKSIILFSDGKIYEGSPSDGENSLGFMTALDGKKVDICFYNAETHPIETIEYIDGTQYKGLIKENLREGIGEIQFKNGETYCGEWKDDTFSGQGIYQYKDKSSYKGQWKDGKKEGIGTYIYSIGQKYEGGWKNGKKEGLGRMTSYDGKEVFEGIFNAEINNATSGKFIFQDGIQCECKFENGKLHGDVTIKVGEKTYSCLFFNGNASNLEAEESQFVFNYLKNSKLAGNYINSTTC